MNNVLLQDIPARRRWFDSLNSVNLKVYNYSNFGALNNDIGFNIFPNPSTNNEEIFIKGINIKSSNAVLKIFSIGGKLILEDNIYFKDDGMLNNSINLSNQPKGLYIISISTAKNTYAEKIIIN